MLLTTKQLKILAHVALGQSDKIAAASMGMPEPTFRNHMTAIFKKLGADNRTHAVVLAYRSGQLDLATVELEVGSVETR